MARLTGRAGDLQRLEMLYLRDHEGLRAPAIAARLGVSEGRVKGALADVAIAEHEVRRAARAAGTIHLDANRDGTMAPRWWAEAATADRERVRA